MFIETTGTIRQHTTPVGVVFLVIYILLFYKHLTSLRSIL
jgi:hypothetical protein